MLMVPKSTPLTPVLKPAHYVKKSTSLFSTRLQGMGEASCGGRTGETERGGEEKEREGQLKQTFFRANTLPFLSG